MTLEGRERRVEQLKRALRSLTSEERRDGESSEVTAAREDLLAARAELDAALRDRRDTLRRAGLRPG